MTEISPTTTASRIRSIDFLRGAVMILMAIDHVRVYSGLPAGGIEPGIFFTRWVTHFCAPAFAFLAGTSAFLYGVRINNKAKLAQYLVTRGLMLVVLELTVLRFFWTFQLDFSSFVLAGVIWMLGWCMILLAAFSWMKLPVVGAIGITIIIFQGVAANVPYLLPEAIRPSFGKLWEFIYPSGFETFANVSVLYAIIPWIGVMAAGYGFGAILLMEKKQSRKVCLITGSSMVAIFIILGIVRAIQTPSTDGLPFLLQVLNQQKYPASVLFLLMTLGPVIALIPSAEKTKGWLSQAISTIGSVAFFYYLLHIPLIHVSALLVQWIRDGVIHPDWFAFSPYVFIEEANRWNLPLLYLVFVIDTIILYFLSDQYARYKSAHREKRWLKYL